MSQISCFTASINIEEPEDIFIEVFNIEDNFDIEHFIVQSIDVVEIIVPGPYSLEFALEVLK